MNRNVLLITVALSAAARVVSAQSMEPLRLTVGVGAGIANPMHVDFNFIAPEWQVSVRARLGGRLTVEGFFSEWQHTGETVLIDRPIESPAGIVGRAGRVTQKRQRITRAVGFNVLGGGGTGRVMWYVGGGVGSMHFRREFTQVVAECVPALPDLCRETRSPFTAGSIGVQGLGGVQVRISPRVLAFGQAQLMFSTRDWGSGHSSVTGGVRFAIRDR